MLALVVAGGAYAEWTPLKIRIFGVEGADITNSPIDVAGTDCATDQLTSAGVTSVPLVNGKYSISTPYPYDFSLASDVKYGNISGDLGKDEAHKAVFVASCGGTGAPTQVLFVYGASGGALVRLAALTLSSGGADGFHSLTLDDGVMKIEQLTGDSSGTATGLVTNTYAWIGNQLVRTAQSNVIAAPQDNATTTGTDTSISDTTQPTGGTLQEASYTYFQQQLAPYGHWMKHPRWGNVWKPSGVPADFRPYQDGHWENTDDAGTVWVSDYSWGDIPFHYGRWGYDASYGGWLWVPGYTWAPAWVSWREGNGCAGWLPMVPGDDYDGSGAYPYDYADNYGYGVPEGTFISFWTFVPEDQLFAVRIRDVVVSRSTYSSFIERTTSTTHYSVERGRIVNRSLNVARYERATGHTLPHVSAASLFHHGVPMVSPAHGRAIAAHEGQRYGTPAHVTPGSSGIHHMPGHPLISTSHYGGEFRSPGIPVGHHRPRPGPIPTDSGSSEWHPSPVHNTPHEQTTPSGFNGGDELHHSIDPSASSRPSPWNSQPRPQPPLPVTPRPVQNFEPRPVPNTGARPPCNPRRQRC